MAELLKFFSETGYRVNKTIYGIDAPPAQPDSRTILGSYARPTSIPKNGIEKRQSPPSCAEQLPACSFIRRLVPGNGRSQAVGASAAGAAGFYDTVLSRKHQSCRSRRRSSLNCAWRGGNAPAFPFCGGGAGCADGAGDPRPSGVHQPVLPQRQHDAAFRFRGFLRRF